MKHRKPAVGRDRRDSVLTLEEAVARLARADAALRESRERYKAMYDNIPLMYFTLDDRGEVLAVNSHGAHELGYEPEELVGQSVLGVFHRDDQDEVSRQLESVLRHPGNAVRRWEFRKVRKDGEVIWVREAVRSVPDGDGKRMLLVVCENISEQKRTEEQLQRRTEQIEVLRLERVLAEERERRRISIGLHDQIGQNLAMARLRLADVAPRVGDADQRCTLKEIRQLIDRTLEATRTLTFELSSPILYEMGLEPALDHLVEGIQEQHGIRFQFETDGKPKPLSEDASILLFRIVSELVRNTVTHARASRAVIAVSREQDSIRIRVEDDGVGFDPGGAGERHISAGHLGLFSVRQQLKHIDGRIDIRSVPGEGCRVDVTAPLGNGS